MYENHENLDNNIFKKYTNYEIVNKDKIKLNDAFYKDPLYVKSSFSYPLTEEEKNNLKTVLKIEKLKNYKDDDRVGVYEIYLKDKLLKRINVYVKVKKKKSFFKKLFSS